MSVKVTVKGVKTAIASLEKRKKAISLGANKGVADAGLLVLREVKESIAGRKAEPASVDTGRFLNSVQLTIKDDNAVVFSDVPYGCLHGRSNITTNKGTKFLSSIKIGDFVLTQDGNYHKVVDKHKYKISDNLIKIETEYRKGQTHKLILTKTHKILVTDGKCFFWKKAKNLTNKDMILTRRKKSHTKGKDITKYKFRKCIYCGKEKLYLISAIKKHNRGKYCSLNCRIKDWRENKNNPHLNMKRTKKTRELQRKIAQKRLKEHPELHPSRIVNKKGFKTNIEKEVENWLKENNYLYYPQFPIGRRIVDYYLPQSNMIIECDGAFWHQNQKKDILRDNELLREIPFLKILHLHFVDKRFSKNIISNPLNRVYYVQCNPSMRSYVDLEEFKPVKILNIKEITPKKPKHNKTIPVYDITVDKFHSYYANGILVSNSFLEYGTSKLRERRHFRNSSDRKKHEVQAKLNTEIKKFTSI